MYNFSAKILVRDIAFLASCHVYDGYLLALAADSDPLSSLFLIPGMDPTEIEAATCEVNIPLEEFPPCLQSLQSRMARVATQNINLCKVMESFL